MTGNVQLRSLRSQASSRSQASALIKGSDHHWDKVIRMTTMLCSSLTKHNFLTESNRCSNIFIKYSRQKIRMKHFFRQDSCKGLQCRLRSCNGISKLKAEDHIFVGAKTQIDLPFLQYLLCFSAKFKVKSGSIGRHTFNIRQEISLNKKLWDVTSLLEHRSLAIIKTSPSVKLKKCQMKYWKISQSFWH